MLVLLHARLATTAAFYTLVMTGWALLLVARGRGLDGSYLGAIVVGELLLVLQSLAGVFLWLQGRGTTVDRIWLHVLYGVMVALIWPFLFTYTRGAPGRRESILFFAGSLFLWGLVLRAMETGALR